MPAPLPLPCQVEILHLEGFKTCAKHVPPGPQNPPCSFSLLPALCQVEYCISTGFHTCARHVSLRHETLLCTFHPLPLPCQVEILHLEKVSKPARSTFHQGPKTLRAALACCLRFARSNIAFRRFPHLRQARFTKTRNPPVHLSPFAAALPGRNSAFRGFQNKHVPPGPQTLPCSFSPLPALCHRPLPLPCQVEILHLEGFKTCAKHVPPGPQNPPCSFSPLPALCQVEYCIFVVSFSGRPFY